MTSTTKVNSAKSKCSAPMGALFATCLATAGSVAQAQSLTVTPTNLAFPNTSTGSRSAKQTLTVTNNGATPVQFAANDVVALIAGGSVYFERDNPGTGLTTCLTNAVLMPTNSCTIGVSFAPQVVMAASASWRLELATAMVTVTPATIPMTGTGVSPPPPPPPPPPGSQANNSGGGVGATDKNAVLALFAALLAASGLRRKQLKRAR